MHARRHANGIPLHVTSNHMLMISDSSPERGELSHVHQTPAKTQLPGTRTRINYTTTLLPLCSLGIITK